MTPGSRWKRRDALAVYEAHAGPNMTPMVDVVMVILIFFMATTVIIGPELLLGAGVESQKSHAVPDARFAIDSPVFELTLSNEGGKVVVEGMGLRRAGLEELEEAARSLASELNPRSVQVVITPGDEVPYAAAIRVQDELIAAGFTSVGLR